MRNALSGTQMPSAGSRASVGPTIPLKMATKPVCIPMLIRWLRVNANPFLAFGSLLNVKKLDRKKLATKLMP